jgi:hypothetical protein
VRLNRSGRSLTKVGPTLPKDLAPAGVASMLLELQLQHEYGTRNGFGSVIKDVDVLVRWQ